MSLLAQISNGTVDIAQLGVAGLMGAMWLWERRTSQKRESQIDKSHARILADRLQIDQLVDVVKGNAQAMTDFAATQRELISTIKEELK